MRKEAEILRTCISCHHDTHLCQKSSKSRGVMYLRCISLQKVTLKWLLWKTACYKNFSSTSVLKVIHFQIFQISRF